MELGWLLLASPSDRKGAALTDRACQEEGIVTIPEHWPRYRRIVSSTEPQKTRARGDSGSVEFTMVDARSTTLQKGGQRAS